jgi:hypothetical protein
VKPDEPLPVAMGSNDSNLEGGQRYYVEVPIFKIKVTKMLIVITHRQLSEALPA